MAQKARYIPSSISLDFTKHLCTMRALHFVCFAKSRFVSCPTRLMIIRSVAGLAGPYHIGDHFLHEATRGVEWASCMWRIVGGHAHFERFSPTAVARVLSDIVSSSPLSVTCLRLAFTPYIRFHLLHGEQDIVVPVSSTQRLYDALTRLGLTVSSSFLMADHAEIMLALHATATVTCRSHVLDIVDTLHSQA
eukprot:m.118803 g.118803  ORF g.118803 m.118803 type:complete len:192 (+) comp15455_c0_seq12:1061-1636(+)